MKTKTQIKTNKQTSKELQSRSEQVSPDQNQQPEQPAKVLPFVNYAQREANRALPTDQVLDLLRQWLPAAYDLAEVVGKWVWVTFPEPPAEQLRGQLSQFGFHWNNTRKCWQHPCGETLPRGTQEPRAKYTVWSPAATAKRRQTEARQEAAVTALGKIMGERSLAQAAA